MTTSNPSEILQHAFDNKACSSNHLNDQIQSWVKCIADNAYSQKGVYTVLVTLLVYKIFEPKQDIRRHQSHMPNGFSGKSIDTKYITPLLKKMGLPSMSESGWLTRSLEQPFPYSLAYEGKISGKGVKIAFLNILNVVEEEGASSFEVLSVLLGLTWEMTIEHHIPILPLNNPDELLISQVVDFLKAQFFHSYETQGGSKLPVLALHSMYTCLLSELNRYQNCTLLDLGSHTASDRTSKTSGDIEVYKENALFESIEVKLDKPIDIHLLRIVKEKIYQYNPTRYYVLSCIGIAKDDVEGIQKVIAEVKEEHGCQIVVNGVLDTLKYYLRLIQDNQQFMTTYLNAIETDKELKKEHKSYTNALIEALFYRDSPC
jgi:DNA (cytosine-5)-methyltransferase 1